MSIKEDIESAIKEVEAGEKEVEAVEDSSEELEAGSENDAVDNEEGDSEDGLQEEETQGQVEEELDPIDPPKSWAKSDLKSWSALPREVQEVISRRETERDNGILQKLQDLQAMKQKYQQIEGAIAPYQEWLHLSQTDLPTALQNYFATQQFLARDPKRALLHLASQLNVSIDELARQTPNQPQLDPQVMQLQQEIGRLKQAQMQQQSAVQQQIYEHALGEVQSFIQATDEAGNLKYPHFAELEREIELLVPVLKQANPTSSNMEVLRQAYERAAWGNESIRSKLQSKELEKVKAQKRTQAIQAKQRAKSVSGSPNGTVTNAPDDSIRGLLEAQVYGAGRV
jgi:predicted Zn-dependent protease